MKNRKILKNNRFLFLIGLNIIAFFLSSFCYGMNDIHVKQRNDAGNNIINFLAPENFGRISIDLSSQATYVKSLAKYPVTPDPSFDEWLQVALDPTVSPEINKIAYADFIKGKRLLESSNDLFIYPSFPSNDEDSNSEVNFNFEKCGASVCPNYIQFLEALNALQISMDISANSWTQLFRGIALTRIRALGLASDDFIAVQQNFKKMSLLDEAELANSFQDGISHWQYDKEYVAKTKMQLTCPKTPEKVREALGSDMGVCTLIFCGKWTGSEDKVTRQHVIAQTLNLALTKLYAKSTDEIKNDPFYSCALAVRDDEENIQQDISKSLLKFMKEVKLYNYFDIHFFKLEAFYLVSKDENNALALLKDNLFVLLKSTSRLDLALNYALDNNINSHEMLSQRLNILDIPENDRLILLQLKTASLQQYSAVESIANKLTKRLQLDLADNELLTANCITDKTDGCLSIILNKISLLGEEGFKKELIKELSKIFRSVELFLVNEGLTEQEENAFRQYQAATERLLEIQNLPSEIKTGINGWLKHNKVIKSTIERVITKITIALNLPPRLSQRFKESLFPLATQAAFNLLILKNSESGETIKNNIESSMPGIFSLLYDISDDHLNANNIVGIISKNSPLLMKQIFKNKLSKNNESLLDRSLNCLIYENKSLPCQESYLYIFKQVYEYYINGFKGDNPVMTKVFLGIGEDVIKRASLRISNNVDIWDAIKESIILSAPDFEKKSTIEKNLSNDEKNGLLILSMVLEITNNKASSIVLAEKLQNNIQVPISSINEIAFVTSAINLCYGKKGFIFSSDQVMKIQSPLMIGLLLATPCIVAHMSIADLDSSFNYLEKLDYGNKTLAANFATLNLQLDFFQKQLDYEHTTFLIEKIESFDGGGIRIFLPLSKNLKKVTSHIIYEDVEDAVNKNSGISAGIEFSHKSLYMKFYGTLNKNDSATATSIALMRSAARSKQWHVLYSLEKEMLKNIRMITKESEAEIVFWITHFSAAILISDNPPAQLKNIALEWAEQYRSYPSLTKGIRIELINGLVAKSFVLKGIQIKGLKYQQLVKFSSVLDLKPGITITDEVVINAVEKLFNKNLIKDINVTVTNGVLILSVFE